MLAKIGIFIWTIAQVKCRSDYSPSWTKQTSGQADPSVYRFLNWLWPCQLRHSDQPWIKWAAWEGESFQWFGQHVQSRLMHAGQLEYISQAVYLFSIGAVKVSILFMYLRAFTGSQENLRFKYTVWVLISLITSAHLVAFFGWVFSQLPPTCHWTYYPNPGEWEKHCYVTVIDDPLASYSLFLNVFTVVMDIIILTLPIRPVWRLQLAKRQKISILLILFAGVMYELAQPRSNDKPSSWQSD